MAGISALSRSFFFEDANTRKFDESDSRRLGQRRKILRIVVGHDTEGDAETRTGKRNPSIKQFATALWHPEGNETDDGEPKIGKKEEDGNRELDECLKGTHRGGLQGRRYEVIAHTQSKGTENRPAEAEQDQHRLPENDQKGDRAGPRDRPASDSMTI